MNMIFRHKTVRHKTVGGVSGVCVVIASVAKQSRENCPSHDSHDFRISRIETSVPLCVPSVSLCVTKNKNYTEAHRGGTELHREKCPNHDFHDLRISRMCMSHHIHHSNHIKITVQTKAAKDAIRGKKVSNLTSHSLTSQKRCIFAA